MISQRILLAVGDSTTRYYGSPKNGDAIGDTESILLIYSVLILLFRCCENGGFYTGKLANAKWLPYIPLGILLVHEQ